MAPPGVGVNDLFEFKNGLISQTVWGLLCCSCFLKSVTSEINKGWSFCFFEKWNGSTNTQRDAAAVMRISSSKGAQPAAIQIIGAADNGTNSSRAIILHASGPKDYFSSRTKPWCGMLTHNFLLSLSAPISCSHRLLATAGVIRQTVARFADVTSRGPESFWGPAVFVGIDFAMAELLRFVSSSAASHNVCNQPFNQRSGNINSSLLILTLSIYLLYLFILNDLSNFRDSSFLAESSASDIITVSGLCGGIYLASAVAAGRLTLITKSPPRTPT